MTPINVEPYESLTSYANNKVLEWRYRENQGNIETAFSIIGSEFAFAGLVVIGTVETVARAFFFLWVKGVSWIVGTESLERFDEDCKKYLIITALATSAAGFQLIGNFFDDSPYAYTTRVASQIRKFKMGDMSSNPLNVLSQLRGLASLTQMMASPSLSQMMTSRDHAEPREVEVEIDPEGDHAHECHMQ